MQALLLIAHGSRREESNQEIQALTQKLRRIQESSYDVVECAFLELTGPSIPEGINRCVKMGAQEITVLPYFLSAGRHVVTDIPNELNKAKQMHSNIKIKVAPYFGSTTEIVDLLYKLGAKAS